MSSPIRLLVVEDSEDDTLLLLHHLQRGGLQCVHERVDTAKSLSDTLLNKDWDIVIADYFLSNKNFTGLEALHIVQQSGKDIPFILLSGVIDENVAVDMMNAGAHDFIMKNQMARLIPAIQRELKALEIRREHKKIQEQLPKSNKRHELDEIDWQIISQLSHDGRMKFTDVAEKITTKDNQGFSHVGVSRRLVKLIENEYIQVQANINLNRFDFVVGVLLIELDVKEDIDEFLQKYKNCPRIIMSARTTGKYNVFFIVIGEDLHSFQDYLNKNSPKVHPGVRSSEVLIANSVNSPKFLPVALDYNKNFQLTGDGGITFNQKECANK
jgi:DNA-binding Lrp family transcriptional regulator/CheY-like chemotaxis protein